MDLMQPVVPPEAMRVVDRAAGRSLPELVEMAGWEVHRTARALLGGTYGRRVVVVAGKGNNGADGRVAARHLERAGSGWTWSRRVRGIYVDTTW